MPTKPPNQAEIKTHCPNGHAYDEVGFYVIKSDPRGEYRRCKKCHADRAKAYRVKRKSEATPKAPKKKTSKKHMSKPLPAAHRVLTDIDCVAFRSLEELVANRLEVALWDLDDVETVKHLESGLPKNGSVMHIFSDEWLDRRKQCVGFIRARAGVFEQKVGARSCKVREVKKGEAIEFLEAFHIQGANRLGVVYFGLYMGDEFVGLMSLGRHSRQIARNRIVMDRLCFRAGIQVIGGPSKLMKVAAAWAREQSYDEVVTFSDNRWTNGNLYKLVGFDLEQNLRQDYYYTRRGWRFSKQSQRKRASGCPKGMTEFEWASYRGLKRVYDAGKKRWVMNLWPETHKTRNDLSSERAMGKQTRNNIRGYFESEKNGDAVYYASSYELRCMFLLEQDESVVAFRRCESFKGESGLRNPDLWVDFVDGRSEVWEVKPELMLLEDDVLDQIRESSAFAKSKGVIFKVWSERDSGLGSDYGIMKWAREHLADVGESSCAKHHKDVRRKIRKRHYKKVQADKVQVECKFCNETHEVLRLAYDRNVKKNSRFICIRENGHLVGKKPKNHLRKTNPHADEGKKQCSTCSEVKSIEAFHVNRASWDGRNPRCKKCCKKKRLAGEIG